MVISRPWILGVETSTPQGSVAIVHHDQVDQSVEISWGPPENHSDVIINRVQTLFQKAQILPQDIGAVVVGCGPGSFTGIRVAINFAKTWAYVQNVPLYLVDTLRGQAEEVKAPSTRILSVCDAFRDLVYAAQYEVDAELKFKEVMSPQALTLHSLATKVTASTITVGSPLDLIAKSFANVSAPITYGSVTAPRALAHIYAVLSEERSFTPLDWKSAKPLYIRASEPEEKLKTGALKPFNSR